MAKMFYKLEEAVQKLRCDEPALKKAVRDGKLREFRDAGTTNYKVEEVDKLAAAGGLGGGPPSTGHARPSAPVAKPAPKPLHADQADLSASLGPLELADSLNPMPDLSSSGTIGLSDSGGLSLTGTGFGSLSGATEPGKGMGSGSGSGISLAGSGEGDALSLDDESVSSDATSVTKGKDDTVVSSVGISVFDEEDLEQSADPKAKTIMTGSAAGGTGLEGVGSGSGLLDLTRESDDTSLGAELLDEIYPSDEGATVEMGEATRAGLDSALVEPVRAARSTKKDDVFESVVDEEPLTEARTTGRTPAMVAAGDPFAFGTSGLIAVAIVVMCFAGLALASMIRGVWPSLLNFVYAKLWMFGIGALVVAGAGMGLGVLLGRRSTDP